MTCEIRTEKKNFRNTPGFELCQGKCHKNCYDSEARIFSQWIGSIVHIIFVQLDDIVKGSSQNTCLFIPLGNSKNSKIFTRFVGGGGGGIKVARDSFGSNRMCQFFCQNLLLMAQAIRKWNNIKWSPCSIFQKMGPNIAVSALLSMESMGRQRLTCRLAAILTTFRTTIFLIFCPEIAYAL